MNESEIEDLARWAAARGLAPADTIALLAALVGELIGRAWPDDPHARARAVKAMFTAIADHARVRVATRHLEAEGEGNPWVN